MSKTSAVLALMAVAAVIVACAQPAPPEVKPSPVERGRTLVTVGGCNDCHTPLKMGEKGPEPDMSRMLSGHPEAFKIDAPPAQPPAPWLVMTTGTTTAWAGPWGVSFTANLTPDQESGLGAWSEDNFIKAMRTGQHLGGGRPIEPPMPWQGIGRLGDDDLKAIFAYLRTVPPIKNQVPDPVPPPAHP
jgi:mono/diheme cytochrome c family protein